MFDTPQQITLRSQFLGVLSKTLGSRLPLTATALSSLPDNLKETWEVWTKAAESDVVAVTCEVMRYNQSPLRPFESY